MNDQDLQAVLKILCVWIASLAGQVTLSGLLMMATLIFTVLQIFMILRRLWKGLP